MTLDSRDFDKRFRDFDKRFAEDQKSFDRMFKMVFYTTLSIMVFALIFNVAVGVWVFKGGAKETIIDIIRELKK